MITFVLTQILIFSFTAISTEDGRTNVFRVGKSGFPKERATPDFPTQKKSMKNRTDHRLWQTEWCEMRGGRDIGMDSALNLACTLHSDLTIGGVTAWQTWIAVSRYNFRDGLIYVEPRDHSITETKRLWALGNFSRYVRPGAFRVGVKSNYPKASASRGGVLVSAYVHAEEHKLIVVAINRLDREYPIELVVPSSEKVTFTPYRTSEDEALKKLSPVELRVGDNGLAKGMVKLAPLSVTTYVAVYERQ